MGSEHLPLRNVGIYRNLPNFDSSLTGLSAIICGASGISGFNTLRALLEGGDRWSTVYTLSRNPISEDALELLSPEQRSKIRHVPIDFTDSPDAIAATLQKESVRGDYVFFYTYLSPKTDKSAMDPTVADDLAEANVPLLQNFLAALPQADVHPKRIVLQTGGKNYGMHIGRVRTPLVESDPQPRHLMTNFYYAQEDALFDYCQQHQETSWNVIRPAGIIGASPSIGMNMFYSFAVYAIVQKYKGEPLRFGGDIHAWQFGALHSTARLTGFLSEWAALEDKCANQAFNAQDGGTLSWDRFFSELARWFGSELDVVRPDPDESRYNAMTMAGGENAPLGYGPPLVLQRSFTLAEWAQESANREAWEEMAKKSGSHLTLNPWDGDVTETMTGDFAYLNFGTLSPNKTKRYGFTGFVDSLESIFEQYQDMARLRYLPSMAVEAARPLV